MRLGANYVGDLRMNSTRASSYIALFLDFLPLFGMAFTILMLKGLKVIKASYMGETLMARLFNVILSSAVGAVLAVGCAAVMPLVYPSAGEASMVGITIFMAVGGVRVVDGLVYKHLGIHLVDNSDASHAESEWLSMSRREREECIKLWHNRSEGAEE